MAYKFNFEKAKELGLFARYTQKQVDTINAILAASDKYAITLKAQLAYIFATAYHECFDPKFPETRMTPMTEFGGEKYLRSKKYYPYYGRGLVQLTWPDNYRSQGKRLGLDLINNPDKVLDIDISADIAVYGMKIGMFTGKKLSDYITANKTDYPNARRIINGMDKMALIASYATKFAQCLF